MLYILPPIGTIILLVLTYLPYYAATKDLPEKERYMARHRFLALALAIVIVTVAGEFFAYRSDINKEKSHREELQTQEGKQDQLQKKIDNLLESNKRLEEGNASILAIAKERYPNLSSTEALEKLKEDLSKLQSRTTVLEQETQKTVFRLSSKSFKVLAGETFETKFTLTPIGENIIPILKIICQTKNNVTFKGFDIKGQTLPGISLNWNDEKKGIVGQEFHNVHPGIVNITIKTDKDPRPWTMFVEPLEKK